MENLPLRIPITVPRIPLRIPTAAPRILRLLLLVPVTVFLLLVMQLNLLKLPRDMIYLSLDDVNSSSYSSSSSNTHNSQCQNCQYKKILYFNKYFHIKNWNFGFGHEPFETCPVSNCIVTNNRSMFGTISKFDAILFHGRDMNKAQIQLPNPAKRLDNQRYVFFLMESPLNDNFNYSHHHFLQYFNWTMTYRRDSDVPRPYGRLLPTSPEAARVPEGAWLPFTPLVPEELSLYSWERPLTAAWLVSNCYTHSAREDYVHELRKFIQVDVFGACGNKTCEKGTKECDRFIEKNYKFVLSFENSLCSGYVTEKFFNAMKMKVVPVVLGGANYSQVAPPKSYINAQDFESPKALAEELIRLSSNSEEYLSYFWWKKHYKVVSSGPGRGKDSMCTLCQKLNQDMEDKVYGDLGTWWRGGGSCVNRKDLPWARPGNLRHLFFDTVSRIG